MLFFLLITICTIEDLATIAGVIINICGRCCPAINDTNSGLQMGGQSWTTGTKNIKLH